MPGRRLVEAPVKRPLSQLIYKRVQDIPASPRILTLHKHNQYGQDVKEYALAANPNARIIGLESYKGVFVGREIVGYTWFIGPFDKPSPLFFGDALAEIERFLWDEIDRQDGDEAELPFLIGVEQGAIMALAAAAAVPDLLSGVIAVEPSLPIVPGWEPPLAPLDGLPILLLDSAGSARQREGVLSGEALATRLRAWNADVERSEIEAGHIPGQEMSTWLGTQTPRYMRE
jgi:predicted esterase